MSTDNKKTCKHCGTEFHRRTNQKPGDWRRQKFCGKGCRDAAQPKGPAKTPRTGRCVRCGEPTSTNRKYCTQMCQYWALSARLDDASLVDRSAGPDGCWLWNGAVTQGQYGVIGRTSRPGVVVLAHRAALERVLGRRIPDGLVAAHHCDHPRCVNPRHLFLTTPRGNMRDAQAKGRLMTGPRTRKLDDATARAIRVRYRQGGVTLTELGEEFGLDGKAVHRIVRMETYRPRWKNVEAPHATIVAGPAPC